jgi:hypothetical protein
VGNRPTRMGRLKNLLSRLWRAEKNREAKVYIIYDSYIVILLLKDTLCLTNHQLFNKKATWDWKAEYFILLGYKGEIERATTASGGRSEAPNDIKKTNCLQWSDLLSDVRTFFEQKSSQ